MSKQNGGAGSEPSMEEILSSIRKIISEDEQKEKSEAASPEAASSATSFPAASSPVTAGEAEAARKAPESTPEPPSATDALDTKAFEEEDDDEVLDLTEALDELDEEPDPAQLDPAESEMAEAESPVDSIDEVPWQDSQSDLDDTDSEIGEEAEEPAPDFSQNAVADFEETPTPAPIASAQTAEEPAEKSVNRPPGNSEEGVMASQNEALMSEDSAKETTTMLTELARASSAREFGEGGPKNDADRILEQLVREALRPQLKEWLDRNLPALVERMVREELRRMTQRAEATVEEERRG